MINKEKVLSTLENMGYSSDESKEKFNLMSVDDFFLKKIKKEFSNIREVVLYCVSINGHNLAYASDGLCSDKDVVMSAVVNRGMSLAYADDNLKNDKNVVMAAVKKSGLALRFASESMQEDRDVVLIAVCDEKSRGLLKFISERLRDDPEIVSLALLEQGNTARQEANLVYVSDRLKSIIGKADPIVALTNFMCKENLSKKIMESNIIEKRLKI